MISQAFEVIAAIKPFGHNYYFNNDTLSTDDLFEMVSAEAVSSVEFKENQIIIWFKTGDFSVVISQQNGYEERVRNSLPF